MGTLGVSAIYVADAFINSLYRLPGSNTVVAVAPNQMFYVSVVDLSVIQDTGIGLPTGLTSVTSVYGGLLIGAKDGVYMKNSGNIWDNVLSTDAPHVFFLGDLLLSYDSHNNVSSSSSGTGWTIKGVVGGTSPVSVNAVKKFNGVYFATSNGLLTDNSTFYSKGLVTTLTNVTGDPITSQTAINDIATSDNNTMVIGLANGTYYVYEAGSFGSPFSSVGLDTIHKVAAVGSDIWLFGYDKAEITSTGDLIKLATGNKLTWQH